MPVVYLRVWDPDVDALEASDIFPSVFNREGAFYTPNQVRITRCTGEDLGCPADGGFKMRLLPVENGDGAATVTLTVIDSDELQGAASFSIRKNSNAAHPPVIAGIASESVSLSGAGYGPVHFVIDDMDEDGENDAVDENGNSTIKEPTAMSDNEDVVLGSSITFTQFADRTWIMRAPPTGIQSGRAVITVTAEDKDHFRSDTSFVLNIIDDGGSTPNTPPSFNRHAPGVSGTFVEQTDTSIGASTDYLFKVSDSESLAETLVVTAGLIQCRARAQ